MRQCWEHARNSVVKWTLAHDFCYSQQFWNCHQEMWRLLTMSRYLVKSGRRLYVYSQTSRGVSVSLYLVFFSVSQLSFIDMVIYGALKATGHYGIRWSRVLRPLLLVNVTEGRQVSKPQTKRLKHMYFFYHLFSCISCIGCLTN